MHSTLWMGFCLYARWGHSCACRGLAVTPISTQLMDTQKKSKPQSRTHQNLRQRRRQGVFSLFLSLPQDPFQHCAASGARSYIVPQNVCKLYSKFFQTLALVEIRHTDSCRPDCMLAQLVVAGFCFAPCS